MKLKTEFNFDAAHRLVGYAGQCSNLHGHIWRVVIDIEGDKSRLDCNGILWDFTNVKLLKDLFDHKTILKDCPENAKLIAACRDILLQNEEEECLYLMKENPTAEHLVTEILSHLKTSNPNLKYKVKVYESERSYAEDESE